MQYFKHMSNMRHDVKIKRLINRYGLEGYGLYNLIIEAITEKLTTSSPVPDLQETAEDIASFYNGDTVKINEMTCFMVNQGLFELDEITGNILCEKIYKFLESNQTRSERIRQMIKKYKESQNIKQIIDVSDSLRQIETVSDKREEENRIELEKNRIKENRKGSWELDDLIRMLDFWNKQDLPKFPKSKYKTGVNIPDVQELLKNLSFYSHEQISNAIINYAKIWNDSNYTVFPNYPTAISFLKKGIDSYYDDAKPFERCLNKQSNYGAEYKPSKENEERFEKEMEELRDKENKK